MGKSFIILSPLSRNICPEGKEVCVCSQIAESASSAASCAALMCIATANLSASPVGNGVALASRALHNKSRSNTDSEIDIWQCYSFSLQRKLNLIEGLLLRGILSDKRGKMPNCDIT